MANKKTKGILIWLLLLSIAMAGGLFAHQDELKAQLLKITDTKSKTILPLRKLPNTSPSTKKKIEPPPAIKKIGTTTPDTKLEIPQITIPKELEKKPDIEIPVKPEIAPETKKETTIPKITPPPTVDLPKILIPSPKDIEPFKPEIETPKIEIPKILTPDIETPNIDFPTIEMPKIDIPDIEIPKIDIPDLTTPNIDIPKIDGPKIEVPKIDIPKRNLPKMDLPKINDLFDTTIPQIELPKKIPLPDELVCDDISSKTKGYKQIIEFLQIMYGKGNFLPTASGLCKPNVKTKWAFGLQVAITLMDETCGIDVKDLSLDAVSQVKLRKACTNKAIELGLIEKDRKGNMMKADVYDLIRKSAKLDMVGEFNESPCADVSADDPHLQMFSTAKYYGFLRTYKWKGERGYCLPKAPTTRAHMLRSAWEAMQKSPILYHY